MQSIHRNFPCTYDRNLSLSLFVLLVFCIYASIAKHLTYLFRSVCSFVVLQFTPHIDRECLIADELLDVGFGYGYGYYTDAHTPVAPGCT